MPDRQAGRVKLPQVTSRFQGRFLVPRGPSRKGKGPAKRARDSHAASGLKSIPSNQRAIPRVEEGDMVGGVAGRGHQFQRAEPIPRVQQAGRWGRTWGEAALQFGLRLMWFKPQITADKAGRALAQGDFRLRQLPA